MSLLKRGRWQLCVICKTLGTFLDGQTNAWVAIPCFGSKWQHCILQIVFSRGLSEPLFAVLNESTNSDFVLTLQLQGEFFYHQLCSKMVTVVKICKENCRQLERQDRAALFRITKCCYYWGIKDCYEQECNYFSSATVVTPSWLPHKRKTVWLCIRGNCEDVTPEYLSIN